MFDFLIAIAFVALILTPAVFGLDSTKEIRMRYARLPSFRNSRTFQDSSRYLGRW